METPEGFRFGRLVPVAVLLLASPCIAQGELVVDLRTPLVSGSITNRRNKAQRGGGVNHHLVDANKMIWRFASLANSV